MIRACFMHEYMKLVYIQTLFPKYQSQLLPKSLKIFDFTKMSRFFFKHVRELGSHIPNLFHVCLAEEAPHQKLKKNKLVSKCFLGNNKCFNPLKPKVWSRVKNLGGERGAPSTTPWKSIKKRRETLWC